MTLENQALHLQIAELEAQLAEARAEADRMDAALREIEERLRTKTKPILDVLRQHQTDEVFHAWKHAVYGSCIHAQLMMRPKAVAVTVTDDGEVER